MDHIGIDVHRKESQVCNRGEGGELGEPRIRTTPEQFPAVPGERPRARILLEASTESVWVARCPEGRVSSWTRWTLPSTGAAIERPASSISGRVHDDR